MNEPSATVLAIVTIAAAFYLRNLTHDQGITWRAAKKVSMTGACK